MNHFQLLGIRPCDTGAAVLHLPVSWPQDGPDDFESPQILQAGPYQSHRDLSECHCCCCWIHSMRTLDSIEHCYFSLWVLHLVLRRDPCWIADLGLRRLDWFRLVCCLWTESDLLATEYRTWRWENDAVEGIHPKIWRNETQWSLECLQKLAARNFVGMKRICEGGWGNKNSCISIPYFKWRAGALLPFGLEDMMTAFDDDWHFHGDARVHWGAALVRERHGQTLSVSESRRRRQVQVRTDGDFLRYHGWSRLAVFL